MKLKKEYQKIKDELPDSYFRKSNQSVLSLFFIIILLLTYLYERWSPLELLVIFYFESVILGVTSYIRMKKAEYIDYGGIKVNGVQITNDDSERKPNLSLFKFLLFFINISIGLFLGIYTLSPLKDRIFESWPLSIRELDWFKISLIITLFGSNHIFQFYKRIQWEKKIPVFAIDLMQGSLMRILPPGLCFIVLPIIAGFEIKSLQQIDNFFLDLLHAGSHQAYPYSAILFFFLLRLLAESIWNAGHKKMYHA